MWEKIKAFLASLGHTFLSEIMTALPQVKQVILELITFLVDEAITYIENKYSPQLASLKAMEPLSAEAKLRLDSQRREEAFSIIKAKIAEDPAKYKDVSDSLIYFHIELSVQKAKRFAEGNHGNFPGGNSNVA